MKATVFLLLFCVVLFCQAETNTVLVELANTDAHRDAIHDTSFNWILAGVCCNVFGIAAAAIADSQPPTHRFLGKSPEYIQIYTQTYKQARRNRRITMAAMGSGGCLIGYLAVMFRLADSAPLPSPIP